MSEQNELSQFDVDRKMSKNLAGERQVAVMRIQTSRLENGQGADLFQTKNRLLDAVEIGRLQSQAKNGLRFADIQEFDLKEKLLESLPLGRNQSENNNNNKKRSSFVDYLHFRRPIWPEEALLEITSDHSITASRGNPSGSPCDETERVSRMRFLCSRSLPFLCVSDEIDAHTVRSAW